MAHLDSHRGVASEYVGLQEAVASTPCDSALTAHMVDGCGLDAWVAGGGGAHGHRRSLRWEVLANIVEAVGDQACKPQ